MRDVIELDIVKFMYLFHHRHLPEAVMKAVAGTKNFTSYITNYEKKKGNRLRGQNVVIQSTFLTHYPCFLLIHDIGKTTFNLAIVYTDLN